MPMTPAQLRAYNLKQALIAMMNAGEAVTARQLIESIWPDLF